MSPHTTQKWFTELLLRHIPITPTPIRDTTPGWGLRGARQDLRLVLGLAATGAIAIGATATSTSTTTTISIGTTISTASKEVSFNTIRNIAETLRMGIGGLQINMEAQLEGRVAGRLVLGPVAVPELVLDPVAVPELVLGPVAVPELVLETVA